VPCTPHSYPERPLFHCLTRLCVLQWDLWVSRDALDAPPRTYPWAQGVNIPKEVLEME